MVKVNVTKNYRLFERSAENRPVDERKHRKLEDSMKRYGFLKCYPIICFRNGEKHLIVKDGQHRLLEAEKLGLPVWWIEDDTDFDVALVNCTAKIWVLRDYAQKFAHNGVKAYQDGLDFSERHNIPVGTAFALLAGTISYTNISAAFIDGTYKIKDAAWAEKVAGIYCPIVGMAPPLKNARFIEACMGVCRVADFDADRFVHNAERCREKLVPYSTKEAYLDMIEAVYNFGRQKIVGLKVQAVTAMRKRNAVHKDRKDNGKK